MSLIINRVWRRYPITINSLISEQVKQVNLQPVKSITAYYDPFHEKICSIRQFMTSLSGYKSRRTNRDTKFINNIVCDRSEPKLIIDLLSGDKIIFNTGNLSQLELLQLYNKHITSTVPKEEEKVELKGIKKKATKSRRR